MRTSLTLTAAAVMLAVTACQKNDVAGANGAGSATQAPQLEGFCQVPGLASPLRQTVLVIDESQLHAVTAAERLRLDNAELFQLLLGLGDPGRSIASGAMVPRERLTVYLAPADGSASRVIFSGCEPGVDAADRKLLAASKSQGAQMGDAFFGKGPIKEAEAAADTFRNALIGALNTAATNAPAARPPAAMPDRSLTRSLQALPQLAAVENGIPRLFLFTDLTQFAPDGLTDVTQARTRGFADADRAHLPLGMAEVHVVGPKPADSPFAQDYARAFFLGSQGRLLSWGRAAFNNLPAAPVKVESYSGQITYAPYTFPMQLRLAVDRNQELINSWIVVKRERSVATPLTGSDVCDPTGICSITTDQGGLAQAWSRSGGPDPVFRDDLPFEGLRQLSAEVRGDSVNGRVFDPMVGRIGSATGLVFHLTRNPQEAGAASAHGG